MGHTISSKTGDKHLSLNFSLSYPMKNLILIKHSMKKLRLILTQTIDSDSPEGECSLAYHSVNAQDGPTPEFVGKPVFWAVVYEPASYSGYN